MTLALGSVLLSLLNLVSAALIAERRRTGWLVALAAQLPWTWYDLWTRQLGFLMLTIFYVPVYVRGWRKAPRPAPPTSSTAVLAPTARTADTIGNEAVVVSAECRAAAGRGRVE
jgi:1-acyl-sn-glycerol-3-phosphate acyltransferase